MPGAYPTSDTSHLAHASSPGPNGPPLTAAAAASCSLVGTEKQVFFNRTEKRFIHASIRAFLHPAIHARIGRVTFGSKVNSLGGICGGVYRVHKAEKFVGRSCDAGTGGEKYYK